MPFPQHRAKHARPALFTPQEFLAYQRRIGVPTPRTPGQVVLGFSRGRVRRAARRLGAVPLAGHDGLYVLGRGARAVGLAQVRGIGGPSLALTAEELIVSGTRRLLIVGFAGAVGPELTVGTTVLCSRALRDEGTSFHYLRAGKWARPSPAFYRQLAEGLRRYRVPFVTGPSWTIDAPYRETLAEVRSVRAQGVRTVEMEASTLFSVARVRGAEAAALFTVSDRLDEPGWVPQFAEADAPLDRLIDLAVALLREPLAPSPRGKVQ